MTKFLDSMFTRDKHYRLDKTFDKNRFQIKETNPKEKFIDYRVRTLSSYSLELRWGIEIACDDLKVLEEIQKLAKHQLKNAIYGDIKEKFLDLYKAISAEDKDDAFQILNKIMELLR